MTSKPALRIWLILSNVLALAAFLFQFWPLALLSILFAALFGHWLFAVGLGLLLDIAWGAPTGVLHYFYFPFTLCALGVGVLGRMAKRYFFDSSEQGTL